MRYEGRFEGGLRSGLWRVLTANGNPAWETTWKAGEWDGPSSTWWFDGAVKQHGQYESGAMTGMWSFWFPDGQLAARGSYRADRKVGTWIYFDELGNPMDYAPWRLKFHEGDWAFDDCSGMPRGQSWPLPPIGSEPLDSP